MFLKTRWLPNNSISSSTFMPGSKTRTEIYLLLSKWIRLSLSVTADTDHSPVEEPGDQHYGMPSGHQPLSRHLAPSASFTTPSNTTRKTQGACLTNRGLRKVGDIFKVSQQLGSQTSTWTQICLDSKVPALAPMSHHFSWKKQKWDMGQWATNTILSTYCMPSPVLTSSDLIPTWSLCLSGKETIALTKSNLPRTA